MHAVAEATVLPLMKCNTITFIPKWLSTSIIIEININDILLKMNNFSFYFNTQKNIKNIESKFKSI